MAHENDDVDWELLLKRIKKGLCTPFLGAGACYGSLPLGADVARNWARQYGYPLEDSGKLERVSQFVVTQKDGIWPKELFAELIEQAEPPDFARPDEPHGVLADLPLPLYLTTNYDDFMTRALQDRRRDPKRDLCRWNSLTEKLKSVFDGPAGYEPTVASPVVFHLHGHAGNYASMVLTEDDYLDYLVRLSKDWDFLPARIQRAMTESSLLFLGYGIADWDFRVLFRALVTYLEKSLGHAHVSVQLVPVGPEASDEQKAQARRFLDKYYGHMNVRVYWGTCREFAAELRQRWEAAGAARA